MNRGLNKYYQWSGMFVIVVGLLINHSLCAQSNIPLGTWRSHFSFNNVLAVEEVGSSIYAATENGIFIFDKSDNSITTISKVNGLQGVGLADIYYATDGDMILIAYKSGNLDVIHDGKITNLDLTSTSQINGSKAINDITTFQNFAYLATDFGVLKFNLEKLEVTETYRELGLNAQMEPDKLNVFEATVLNDSLFIATEQGILAANLVENINLLDYTNWKRYGLEEGIPPEEISVMSTYEDKLIAGIDNDQLYQYTNGQWEATGEITGESFYSLRYFDNQIIATTSAGAYEISSQLHVVEVDNLTASVKDGIKDADGSLWFGTQANGLITNTSGSYTTIAPSGPAGNEVFRLKYINNQLYVLPGGYTTNGDPLGSESGYYVFKDGNWKSFLSSSVDNPIPEFRDILDVAYHQALNSYFLASAGYGLLKVEEDNVSIINETTEQSPLVNTNPPDRGVYIPAVASSAAGLWVLNYNTGLIHLLNNENQWQSFDLPLGRAAFANDVIVVEGMLWFVIDQKASDGIVVFEPETGNSRTLTSVSGQGGLPSNKVNSLALDKEDFIWVGTDIGVSVFSNPYAVFTGSVDGIEPIFDNRQLLRDEIVTDIEVDGGNRKWMGTTNGVWLFDDEADFQLQFFNVENSPMPSNNVIDIEINDGTGEVFIATDAGIVSFRSDATEGEETHTTVEIFPNPVRKDFQGTVGISGLASDALVKITDANGKLIWQTQANGSTASWQVRDVNGNRAATGVYLVFSATKDGEDTFVGKIAVIN